RPPAERQGDKEMGRQGVACLLVSPSPCLLVWSAGPKPVREREPMAKKETLTRNGSQEPCVNVDAPVGPTKIARVKNLPGDVMLIQAIFHILARRLWPGYIGLPSMDQVPTPNGHYDLKTETAILRYQTTNRSGLLQADGIIDPASYHHRNIIDLLDSRLMTITSLHLELRILFDPIDYTTELTRLVPQLLPWLT